MSFYPASLSSVLRCCSLSLSFLPLGRGNWGIWDFASKTQGGKLCRIIWSVSPFSVLWNVIHTQETLSKEAQSSWLQPDNAPGSFQLLQILVLLSRLFVQLLPLCPSRGGVYLPSMLRSCQKMRAKLLPFWSQVRTLKKKKVYFSVKMAEAVMANVLCVQSCREPQEAHTACDRRWGERLACGVFFFDLTSTYHELVFLDKYLIHSKLCFQSQFQNSGW